MPGDVVRLARGICLTLLLLTPILMAVSAERAWREVRPYSGLMLAQRDGGVFVDSVIAGSPAARAGLVGGEQLTLVKGKPVHSRVVTEDRLAEVKPGRPVGLTVITDAGSRTLRITTDAAVHWYPERAIAAAVGVAFYLAAIAVWMRRRNDSLSLVYAFWCLAGAIVLGVTWSSQAKTIDWVLVWFDRVARVLLPALWLHWTLLLGVRHRRAARWAPLLYAPVVPLLMAEVLLVGLNGARRFEGDAALAVVDLLQSRLEMGWIAVALLGGVALLVPLWRQATDPSQRARARWVLIGALFGVLPLALLSALPMALLGRELLFANYAVPALALIPLTFTGAILEYRLMDLTLFARRALTLATTVGLALILFLGLASLVRMVFGSLVGTEGLLPLLIAAAVTVALTPTLKAITRDLVGRVFYRRRYSFRRALEHVARDLNAERDLPRLVQRLEARVREALDAGEVRLLFVGPQGVMTNGPSGRALPDRLEPLLYERLSRGDTITLADIPSAPVSLPELHERGAQLLVPLRVEEVLIAVLAVGPRVRGTLLDSDDKDMLRSVAAHAASAVAGAVHLAELRQQMSLVDSLRARTEAVIESSPIGMAVIDREGIVRHWNPSLETLLALPRSVADGRPYSEVLPPAVAPLVDSALAAPFAAAPTRAYRVRIALHGGPQRWVNLTASPLHGPAGGEGIVLTLDDVSEQVQMEQRLIQQDRLASVGLLAAGVAHEVNTPLTGISSFAQMLLEETPASDTRRTLLEKIVQQAGRASRIARDLLRLSRPTSKEGEMARTAVDLRELVEETVGLLAPQVRRASVTIERDWNGEAIIVWGDRSRLQQVTMNLLLNALDAVLPGGKIRVHLAHAEAGQVEMDIEDNGAGIPESVRAKIFDPFFTTKKPGAGTGLGLSISYAIVREHGGQLVAESEQGQGTVMRVMLPAAAPSVADSRAS